MCPAPIFVLAVAHGVMGGSNVKPGDQAREVGHILMRDALAWCALALAMAPAIIGERSAWNVWDSAGTRVSQLW